MRDWVERLLAFPGLAVMGHGQRPECADLGLGWLYYGLARAVRARNAVVIGSFRGFVPIILGRALMENAASGETPGDLHFIDPSLVDAFWKDPAKVRAHFDSFGVANITHHLATTQSFVTTTTYAELADIDLLFIDGYHSAEQARFDHEAFTPKLTPGALVLFHDSVRPKSSVIYSKHRPYIHSVHAYMDDLRRDPQLQVFSLPNADAITIVRRALSPADREPTP